MKIINLQYTVMTRVRDFVSRTLFAIFLAIAISACGDGEAPVSDRLPVSVAVDWSACSKVPPQGMTMLWHHQVSGETTCIIGNDTEAATAFLAPGQYRLTVFNLTEGEFDNIRFRGLGSPDTAEAYLREADSSKWFAPASDDGGYVAGQPEWLAADTMLSAVDAPGSGASDDSMQFVGTLCPKALTRNLHLTLHIGNICNMLSARGALSGLAAGRMLAADVPLDGSLTVTHLIESDSWTKSDAPDGSGVIEADIRCFGLPSDHDAAPDANRLIFQALLPDGRACDYVMPVGNLIRRADDDDLSLELWLDPPLPQCNHGGGIDVWFDDWDESIDFNLKL